jgi:prepilin-type N-terminal cleavage/methylation domain-containing protein
MARRAFSLLEVLIALSILTVVMSGIYTVLIQGTRSMGQGTARLDAVSDLSRVVEAMRRDARSIYWKSDNPILVSGTVPDLELSFSIVVGVTTDGVPVVVPVLWKFEGESTGVGGSLQRIYSAGLPGERVKTFFSGQLRVFDIIKYDAAGEILTDDTVSPSFLECDLEHALGTSLRLTLFLNSRYQISEGRDPMMARWIPNSRITPFDPTVPVITAAGGGTTAILLSEATLTGGAVVTSGEAMTQSL